jgi:hypothetical protein
MKKETAVHSRFFGKNSELIFSITCGARHKHFQLHQTPEPSLPQAKIIMALVVGMFFSPCLEIEAYFLMAGTKAGGQC